MIKYKVNLWHNSIMKIEVIKETDKQIIEVNGRRLNKISQYECFFDTYDQAKIYLMTTINNNIMLLNNKLQCEQNNLKKVMELKEVQDANR